MIGLYVAYIVQFGINVPHWDDWQTVQLLASYRNGTLHFSQLWAQQNEGRLLVPNIIAIVVGELSHFNLKVEMYLGAVLLAVGVFTR